MAVAEGAVGATVTGHATLDAVQVWQRGGPHGLQLQVRSCGCQLLRLLGVTATKKDATAAASTSTATAAATSNKATWCRGRDRVVWQRL